MDKYYMCLKQALPKEGTSDWPHTLAMDRPDKDTCTGNPTKCGHAVRHKADQMCMLGHPHRKAEDYPLAYMCICVEVE